MNDTTNPLLRAQAAFQGKQFAEAETLCREWIAHNPVDVPALLLLGAVQHADQRYLESIETLQRALRLEPDSMGVLSRLGSAHHAAGQFSQAAECFARCVQLDPDCPDAYHHLAKACFALRNNELAVQICRRALALNPKNYKTWNNLGSILRDLVQLEEALQAYDQALALCPDSPHVHWNRGTTLLKLGRLEEGFRDYEARRQLLDTRFLSPKSWTGEPIPDQTLFLMAEQGFGDMIHFVRYTQLVQPRVGKLILECHPPLHELFEFSGCADVVCPVQQPPPDFDVCLPLMSLPAILGTTFETIPSPVPYLRAPPGAALPQPLPGNFRVGLVWAGNPKHDDNDRRDIPTELLTPLLETRGVTFYGLQLHLPPRDRVRLHSFSNFIDLSPRLKHFIDTAGLVGQLDLVISVDSAVAHLAGALGKPVWTFIQHASDWRWFMDRTDSPWYPTLRLFRQEPRGDWRPVLARGAAELARLAAGKPNALIQSAAPTARC